MSSVPGMQFGCQTSLLFEPSSQSSSSSTSLSDGEEYPSSSNTCRLPSAAAVISSGTTREDLCVEFLLYARIGRGCIASGFVPGPPNDMDLGGMGNMLSSMLVSVMVREQKLFEVSWRAVPFLLLRVALSDCTSTCSLERTDLAAELLVPVALVSEPTDELEAALSLLTPLDHLCDTAGNSSPSSSEKMEQAQLSLVVDRASKLKLRAEDFDIDRPGARLTDEQSVDTDERAEKGIFAIEHPISAMALA